MDFTRVECQTCRVEFLAGDPYDVECLACWSERTYADECPSCEYLQMWHDTTCMFCTHGDNYRVRCAACAPHYA